jgi:hypothetical protein
MAFLRRNEGTSRMRLTPAEVKLAYDTLTSKFEPVGGGGIGCELFKERMSPGAPLVLKFQARIVVGGFGLAI